MSEILKKIYDETPKEQLRRFKYAERIGEYLYSFIKSENTTQAKLAEELDMEPTQLHRYVNGEANLTLETIAKLEIGTGHNIISIRKPLTYGKGVVQTWQVERSQDENDDTDIYKIIDHQEIPHGGVTTTTKDLNDEKEKDNQVYSFG